MAVRRRGERDLLMIAEVLELSPTERTVGNNVCVIVGGRKEEEKSSEKIFHEHSQRKRLCEFVCSKPPSQNWRFASDTSALWIVQLAGSDRIVQSVDVKSS